MTLTGALILILVFETASVFLLVSVFAQKVVNNHRLQKQVEARDYIFRHYLDDETMKKTLGERFFFDAFIEVENQVKLDPEVREKIIEDLLKTSFCRKQFRKVRHGHRLQRKQAAFYLQAIGTPQAKEALRQQLMRERNPSVRFYLLNALILDLNADLFKVIIDSLERSDPSYRHWVEALLKTIMHPSRPIYCRILRIQGLPSAICFFIWRKTYLMFTSSNTPQGFSTRFWILTILFAYRL